ncbi:MAG: hypothetical protein KA457_07720 [Chitinophagales bacterium]|jgi:hypothetical protein|nr:hypothetical protein [Chitinophagales bacterium]MBP6154693.1 hypothetical protein [Chitinophagales bacterium]
MKKIITFCIICVLFFNANAQYPKEFPADNAGYGKMYADFVKNHCTREDCKEVSEKLPKAILSGKASTYFFKIKGITQSMLVKKAAAYPTFFQFANLLLVLETTKTNALVIDKNFDILQTLIDKSKPGNIKEFTNYIVYLNDLYAKNAIYYTNTNTWQATGDYTVEFKDDKPVYSFSSTDLIGISNVDTLILKNEKGIYYPLENVWLGKSGSIFMQRKGFDPVNNFVTFGNHQINFAKSDIIIDSAKFTFKPVLSEVLLGTYTDKLLQATSQERLYPKFRSYSNNVNFNTLSKEVKMKAGFELIGTDIFGVGSDSILPTITLLGKNNKELVRVTSNRIQLKEFKNISVEDASMTIYLDSNSISHPFVNFSYASATKDVKAYRDMKPLSKQPFTSDYHKLFLFADELRWNLDSTIMRFSMITLSGDKPAIFESFNYYQPNLENKYKGANEQGPIDKIYRYYESTGNKYVDAVSIALDINPGAPFSATQHIFFKLVEDAYINYNPSTRIIEVKEKLINQALSAKGKQDYDFIKFASFKRNLNARLNIKTNLLEIYGVEEINMSTKSGVKFIPSNDTVRVGKNRVMTLNGKIQVGNFDFVAQKVDFDYDNYAFKMKNVDSMVIYVPESDKPNENGVIRLIRSKTPLQNITGTLHIAEPNNKSGTNNNQKYPYFTSADTSKITYDKGANGDKYDKNKFYYQVYPFELDSLNQINTELLQLDGQLVSGGIFEPIKSGLKLQNDKAYGIDVNTGAKGYNLFGNKGKYIADLKLDGNGLSGKGLFEFGPAKLYADTSFFFMDSVYADLDSVRITEDKVANMPQTRINQSSFVWNVKRDSLTISEGKDENFSMYNNTTDFNGKLILHNKNLYGVGILSWNHTKLQSEDITFKARKFEAKNGNLNLSTDDGISLLASNDVNAKFDLDNKIADIELNKNDTIPLESFKYVANPKFLHFDLAKNKITLNAASSSSKFFLLSTDVTKDSLKFVTAAADLNLADNSIHFAGINELRLADSKVIPDKGEIFIEQDGTVRTLKNATILFNAEKEFHTVKDAEVNVIGRNDFNGTGNYYFKLDNTTTEKIVLSDINVHNPYRGIIPTEIKGKKGKKQEDQRDLSKIYTFAKTVILEEDKFKLDKKIYYKGNFDFDSKSKDIYLDGAIKVEISNNSSDWIANIQTLDPKKPAVSMDSILNQANNNLFVGLMLDKNTPEFYAAILQDKRSSSDASIMNVKGSMQFSKTEPGTIVFGDEIAFTSPYSYKSCLKYNENTKAINASGEIGFGLDIKPCKITSVGIFNFNPSNQKLEITADLAVNFKLQPYVSNTIIDKFLAGEGTARFVSYKRNKSIFRDIAVLSKDSLESNRIIANVYAFDSLAIPSSSDYNMLIHGSKFYWDDQDASFKSVEKVSLAYFGSTIVKREYDAYIELGYAYGGDFVNIYLQGASGNWIFLKIIRGQMGIASSIPEVQNEFFLLRDADKIYREGKEVLFQLLPADLGMRDNFVIRMEDFKARFKVGTDINKPIAPPTETPIETPTEPK